MNRNRNRNIVLCSLELRNRNGNIVLLELADVIGFSTRDNGCKPTGFTVTFMLCKCNSNLYHDQILGRFCRESFSAFFTLNLPC